jgi:DNA polymerase-3 subunit chi
MTRIDFYVSTHKPEWLACRVAERAYSQSLMVYIHTNSHEQSTQLDEMLWIFKPESFVPHGLQTDFNSDTPVHIGHDADNITTTDVLINLNEGVPLFFSKFARMAEIICPDTKAAGRARYKFYQDRGYPLDTHNID